MKVKDASEIRRLDANKLPAPRAERADGATPATDKVSTDSKAQLDAAVSAARAAIGHDRTIRLEAIEAAVRNGTFKPDPQRIANKILADAELTAVLQSMLLDR